MGTGACDAGDGVSGAEEHVIGAEMLTLEPRAKRELVQGDAAPGRLQPRSRLRSRLSGMTPTVTLSPTVSRPSRFLSVSALRFNFCSERPEPHRGQVDRWWRTSTAKGGLLLASLVPGSVERLQGRPELVGPLPCLAPSARTRCHVSAETRLATVQTGA